MLISGKDLKIICQNEIKILNENMKRKKFLLLVISIAVIVLSEMGCKKSAVSQVSLLPPITDTGANTFGCLVNGVAMLPKTEQSSPSLANPWATSGIIPGLSQAGYGDDKINIGFTTGWQGSPILFMEIDIYDSMSIKPNTYQWNQANWSVGSTGIIDPVYYGGIYGEFTNPRTKQYDWFSSFDNSGSTTITRFDTVNHITSGIFSGKLAQRFGSGDTINITDGRFDINWTTVTNKYFP